MEVLGIKLTEIKIKYLGAPPQTIIVADTGQFNQAVQDMNNEIEDHLKKEGKETR